jgi:hypothetical protein
MGGAKRRPAQSFIAGRVENLKLGASKRKYEKWKSIRKGTLGQKEKAGKKKNSKGQKEDAKRMQKKNHGRTKAR